VTLEKQSSNILALMFGRLRHTTSETNLQNQKMDLIGEFSGTVVDADIDSIGSTRTILLYSDHLEIPEARLLIEYHNIREVFGGRPSQLRSQLSREELGKISKFRQVIVLKFKDENGSIRMLFLSWKADGIDGLDYCQIMLYRAFAANRVRSKNNGEPCYGILGY